MADDRYGQLSGGAIDMTLSNHSPGGAPSHDSVTTQSSHSSKNGRVSPLLGMEILASLSAMTVAILLLLLSVSIWHVDVCWYLMQNVAVRRPLPLDHASSQPEMSFIKVSYRC